jgi:hypothetical protein
MFGTPVRPSGASVPDRPQAVRTARRRPFSLTDEDVETQGASSSSQAPGSRYIHKDRVHGRWKRGGSVRQIATMGTPYYQRYDDSQVMDAPAGRQTVHSSGFGLRGKTLDVMAQLQRQVPAPAVNVRGWTQAVHGTRMLCKYYTKVHLLTNQSTAPCRITAYEVICKSFAPAAVQVSYPMIAGSGDTAPAGTVAPGPFYYAGLPVLAWTQGYAETVTPYYRSPDAVPQDPSTLINVVGEIPTHSAAFNRFWRITSRRSWVVAPGDTIQHRVKWTGPRMLDTTKFFGLASNLNNQDPLPGFSTYTMFVLHGLPTIVPGTVAPISTPDYATTSPVRVAMVSRYSAAWSALRSYTGAPVSQAYPTNLLTAMGTEGVNPVSGLPTAWDPAGPVRDPVEDDNRYDENPVPEMVEPQPPMNDEFPE